MTDFDPRVDLYALLGIPSTSTAAEIRQAYWNAMKAAHPDRNREPDAVRRTQSLNAAKSVLLDAEVRRRYDTARRQLSSAALWRAVQRARSRAKQPVARPSTWADIAEGLARARGYADPLDLAVARAVGAAVDVVTRPKASPRKLGGTRLGPRWPRVR